MKNQTRTEYRGCGIYPAKPAVKRFSADRRWYVKMRMKPAAALDPPDPQRVFTGVSKSEDRSVIFMFSGQGAQYQNMGLGLYRTEPVFRKQIDRCSEILKPHMGIDLRDVLYQPDESRFERFGYQPDDDTRPACNICNIICRRKAMDVMGNRTPSHDRSQYRRIRCSLFFEECFPWRTLCIWWPPGVK